MRKTPRMFPSFGGFTFGFMMVVIGIGLCLLSSDLAIRWILSGSPFYATLFGCAEWFMAFVLFFSFIFGLQYRSLLLAAFGLLTAAFGGVALNLIPLEMGRKILPVVDSLQSPLYAAQGIVLLAAISLLFLSFVVTTSIDISQLALTARGKGCDDFNVALRGLDSLSLRMLGLGFVLLTTAMLMLSYWELGAWATGWSFDFADSTLLLGYAVHVLLLHSKAAFPRSKNWGRQLNAFVRLPVAATGLALLAGHYLPWQMLR